MEHMDVNPMGLNGFEFAEFTSPEPDKMAALFEQMGFTAAATHPTRAITRYKQGRINLLLNRESSGHAADFRAAHGPSASAMAFRVQDAQAAYDAAIERGAKPGADGALDAPVAHLAFTQSTRPAALAGATAHGEGPDLDFRYLLMPVRLQG